MKTFNHKVAAITGAGSGIGQQLALRLAQAGCSVALSDVNAAGLETTANLLKAYPVKVTTHVVNVADKDAVYAWADSVVNDHGKVNLIFNNAGIAMGSTVEGHSIADYEKMMGINFWGVVYGTKAFLPYLKASKEGHIVNISSLFGITAQPTQSAYNASKFAVRGFTESLRQELDMMNCGVSATCVHPGGIKTNIAASATQNESIREVGLNPNSKAFEKLLKMPAVDAANVILKAVQANKRRILVGNDAIVIDLMQRLLPTGYQKIIVGFTQRFAAKKKAKK